MPNKNGMLSWGALAILIGVVFALQPTWASAQMTSVGIDCSQIQALHLMEQDNMGASRVLIECGILPGGHSANRDGVPAGPPNIRVSNRKCGSAGGCTHAESMVWGSTKDGGKTIVVNYDDDYYGDGTDYSGTSYSTDGGATFHEISPPPFATGHGTNWGDPIVVFNSKLNMFFAGDLALGCGGGTLGGVALWTSSDGKTWTVGACAHLGKIDDRESMWVDNEPTSGTYGRMYISFNDYAVYPTALSVVHSDDGSTWSSPVIIAQENGSDLIRDVQITGTPAGTQRYEGNNSTVFVAAMAEGGGGFNQRQNLMFKSLDGGNTWTSATLGPAFKPTGDMECPPPYWVAVAPIWMHMGWGEPAVGPNGVVHYDYSGAGAKKADHGDIYYVRSTDNGNTWSAPIKLNPDPDGKYKTQWMPTLSADLNGKVTASWYDRRKAHSACVNATDPGCRYEEVGRQSSDNGATWGSSITISKGLIPQPAQQDSNIKACWAGDYNYATSLSGSAYVTWTDGHRNVGGTHVEDVDFAKLPLP